MTPYININDVGKWFGDLELYSSLNLTIGEGDKCALIARNGAGKTTLLNMIAGKDTPDKGEIIYRNGITVGYLEQEPSFPAGVTVLDAIYHNRNERSEAVKEYEQAMSTGDTGLIGKAVERMDAVQAWDYESRAKTIFTKLKITDINRKVDTLSGGERKRVALAMLLIQDPDVLILDEPTNHIDLDMAEWLEDFLIGSNKTLFMVTHDRYFLDRVCSVVYEIDQKQLYQYKGNYSDYIRARDERLEQFNTEVDKARNIYRRELEWMRRMPQARGTKAKYRKDAFYETEEKAFRTRNDDSVNINIRSSRIGTKIFEAKDVCFSYPDKTILKNYSYTFTRYEKMGIVGRNGTGKSTFLNLLTGKLEPQKGTLDIGPTVKFGYYRQQEVDFDKNKKIIDVATDIAEVVSLGDGKSVTASQFLNMFLFSPEMQQGTVAKLSGGELRRLYLLTVLMRSPNFLILDEPTNDLDIMTLNILEEYLENFEGCLIVVSHDRYFMDKVVDKLVIFEGNGVIREFAGKYTEYRNKKEEEELAAKPAPAPVKDTRVTDRKKKLSFKEKAELESLTAEIALLEKEKTEIERLLSGGEEDAAKISELSARYSEVSGLLDGKEMRWLELSDI